MPSALGLYGGPQTAWETFAPKASASSFPAPTGLAASNVAATSLRLTWTEQNDEVHGEPDKSEVWQAPDVAGSPGTWAKIGEAALEGFNVSNLTAETTYWFRVRAYWFTPDTFSSYTAAISETTAAGGVLRTRTYAAAISRRRRGR